MINILRSQVLAAYRFIDEIKDSEVLLSASLMYNPTESYSLVVKFVYRKSGTEAAPLSITNYMSVAKNGLLTDCRQLCTGNAYYGYIGSLLPLSLEDTSVKIYG